MHIHVLGSAAGGGFPQWNCNCANCGGLRRGEIKAQARTQSSIAISADEHHWLLINASPDIRAQINAFTPLQPQHGVRGTGIAAVLLVDSQIDHATGLLMLREGSRLELYGTSRVHEDLTAHFPLLTILSHYCGVNWHDLPLRQAFEIAQIPGLHFTAVPLISKAPPYSPHRATPQAGDNIGLWIEDLRSGGKLFYAPGLGRMEPHLEDYLAQADCLLLDGTTWTEDEMIRVGAGSKLASEMGHLPLAGPHGLLALLEHYPRPRKILIHINNTNPILDENSAERALLAAQDVEVAWDGMDIEC